MSYRLSSTEGYTPRLTGAAGVYTPEAAAGVGVGSSSASVGNLLALIGPGGGAETLVKPFLEEALPRADGCAYMDKSWPFSGSHTGVAGPPASPPEDVLTFPN